jgi:hypothetical protein
MVLDNLASNLLIKILFPKVLPVCSHKSNTSYTSSRLALAPGLTDEIQCVTALDFKVAPVPGSQSGYVFLPVAALYGNVKVVSEFAVTSLHICERQVEFGSVILISSLVYDKEALIPARYHHYSWTVYHGKNGFLHIFTRSLMIRRNVRPYLINVLS